METVVGATVAAATVLVHDQETATIETRETASIADRIEIAEMTEISIVDGQSRGHDRVRHTVGVVEMATGDGHDHRVGGTIATAEKIVANALVHRPGGPLTSLATI